MDSERNGSTTSVQAPSMVGRSLRWSTVWRPAVPSSASYGSSSSVSSTPSTPTRNVPSETRIPGRSRGAESPGFQLSKV